ncbi:MAG: 2,3-epoxybenzoyl-CoA dihydrolase [Alphaproteobacteria bacterium]|nr:2,3-epoxybenzoyl-CoA dihydrolase [Alphaproteobacteria bacterium]
MTDNTLITYDHDPAHYRHWSLAVDGAVATLTLRVDEEGGLRPGYRLKQNSYDLGVDIELNDALNRLRFEHPQVRAVIVTSGMERMFSAGANIYMLAGSSHAAKVNFCRFTNETRNFMEDASRRSGIAFIAACNGTAAGGGYELALACDEIWLVDDRSSAVSLPEVPLLGVLPGTGGLTRITDKRRVRRDLADVFCTDPDGARGRRALEWGLVDRTAPPQRFEAAVRARAEELATRPGLPPGEPVALTPLKRHIEPDGYRYPNVRVRIDDARRLAEITVSGPSGAIAIERSADWWPLAAARELEDAVLMLRTNHERIGAWVLRTEGDGRALLAVDALLAEGAGTDRFLRETVAWWRRALARLDVTSRSLIALIEPGSCFAGPLMELALAADRSFMFQPLDEPETAPRIALGALNRAGLETANGRTRLDCRFSGAVPEFQAASFGPEQALAAGLVTFAPDELDWEDEVRIALEERAALSPDALTGMEASLRFGGAETLATKIFGRLSAWQNWIFSRPNAVGEEGALKRFGSGTRPGFDWRRV